MPVNKYFNFFSTKPTADQRLIERIIAESIRIMGEDCYYMPRESWSSEMDLTFGEDVASRFTKAFVIEMYHNTVDKFGGAGDMFTKFGYRQKDTIDLEVSSIGWKEAMNLDIRTVPREGDLIYVPSERRLWEIKFVEQNAMFHTLGRQEAYKWVLSCELFRYSHEDIDTGVEEIDILDDEITYTITMTMITPGSGDYHISETVTSPTGTAKLTGWDYQNKIARLTNIRGFFSTNTTLTGVQSGSAWTIQTIDDGDKGTKYDFMDNQRIQTTSNNTINRTENNIFGIP